MGSRYGRQLRYAGEPAPAFRLKDLDGCERSLEELTGGGPVLLAFFKTTCPVCQYTFPFLERLARSGMRVFGISQDGVPATREYNSDFGVTFPTLLDPAADGYAVSNAYGISVVPTLFLVGADGKIQLTSEGFVKRDLEALAAEVSAAVFRPDEYVPEWKAG